MWSSCLGYTSYPCVNEYPAVADKMAQSYFCPNMLALHFVCVTVWESRHAQHIMCFSTSEGKKQNNHWMYALETCKRDSSSLPNLCIMKKIHYWEVRHALLERNFRAQRQVLLSDSQHQLWLHSSIFTMCLPFWRLKGIPLCFRCLVHTWAGFVLLSCLCPLWNIAKN